MAPPWDIVQDWKKEPSKAGMGADWEGDGSSDTSEEVRSLLLIYALSDSSP